MDEKLIIRRAEYSINSKSYEKSFFSYFVEDDSIVGCVNRKQAPMALIKFFFSHSENEIHTIDSVNKSEKTFEV